MSPIAPASHNHGLTLPQAALIAGLGLLIMVIAAPFAEFLVWSKLVVPGNIEQTVHNFQASRGLLLAGIFAYLITFICDVIVAWALYVLLMPVNRSLSLLTAWFRLVYTVVALVGLMKLVSVFRLLNTPDLLSVIGSDQLHSHVYFLLKAFRHEWSFGLILFGIHLLLLGYLVFRSGYIPRFLGILLVIAGLGWVLNEIGPFLLPNADLGFLFITFFGELFFMAWLLIWGRKISGNVEAPTTPN